MVCFMRRGILALLALLAAACLALPCAAEEEKTPARCGIEGHYVGDGLDHHKPESCWIEGHFLCDGRNHDKAVCGVFKHYNCDGLAHGKVNCDLYGHCASDGLIHEPAPCGIRGHYTCDGKSHVPAACGVEGHYACEKRAHKDLVISKYCDAAPQHKVCEGDPEHYCDPAQGGCGKTYRCSQSNAHTPCRMCGLLWCDRTLGGHETPCGVASHRPCVYTMNGKTYKRSEHETCGYCGKGYCLDLAHGVGICVKACPECGGPERYGCDHYQEDCGHFWCKTKGPHVWCDTCHDFACKTRCGHISQ